ncbi:MAG: hypothetical protein JJ897_12890 [Marinibacterium sp.]|nr:hypothetical protein [Marinibacterium sp.]
MTGPILTPVAGTVFEDTIDGYFPLHLSLRQMLNRQDFAAALVILRHAPIMHLPGLPEDAPVPLRLPDGKAGLIHRLMVLATRDEKGASLQSVGRWRWLTTEAPLGPSTRLAEPAFLRGIGFKSAIDDTSVSVCGAEASRIVLTRLAQHTSPSVVADLIREQTGWSDCRAWTLPTQAGFVAETADVCWGNQIVDRDAPLVPGCLLLTDKGTAPHKDIARALAKDA